MKKFHTVMFFVFLATFPNLASAESISRYITIKTCNHAGECIGPTAKNLESANLDLEMQPAHGKAEGHDAWDRQEITEAGVKIKSEIHVIRYKKPEKYTYYIYAMLRTGKRNGVIKTLSLKRWEDFKEFVLTDSPLKTANGTIHAQLAVGPGKPTTP
jgi:hypothetical protein